MQSKQRWFVCRAGKILKSSAENVSFPVAKHMYWWSFSFPQWSFLPTFFSLKLRANNYDKIILL